MTDTPPQGQSPQPFDDATPRRRGDFTSEQRGVLLAAGVVVAVLVIGFILSATVLRDRDSNSLGDERFQDLRAADVLLSVRSGGPLYFADLTDGGRDIYVTHIGDDELSGFLAFSARNDATACLVQWAVDDGFFTDLCDPTQTFPEDGAGLTQYPVELNDGGRLSIDLNFADRDAEPEPADDTDG